LNVLSEVVSRYRWICHAYCLMGNHYHLMIETPEANLTMGMRQLNGVFTQWSNRRHQRSGHLFQGRYKAIVVDRDAYFLELARYIVLNPVRAAMVKRPQEWAWSSYGPMIGKSPAPAWLTIDVVLEEFGKSRLAASRKYQQFVEEGVGQESLWKDLKGQIYLGDDSFIEQMRGKLGEREEDVNIPSVQRRAAAPTLTAIGRQHKNRNDAIRVAYETGAYSYQQIAQHLGVHFTTVGRIVRESVKGEGGSGRRK
jgi:putative transposase